MLAGSAVTECRENRDRAVALATEQLPLQQRAVRAQQSTDRAKLAQSRPWVRPLERGALDPISSIESGFKERTWEIAKKKFHRRCPQAQKNSKKNYGKYSKI
jgi:hypothetical protein